jgi:hypothetical protein
LRIEQLTRQIAAAPRGVVLALVALSVLISPGFLRVSRDAPHGLTPQRPKAPFAERDVAVFELSCADGVFSLPCLRLVALVTQALEQSAGVVGPVRSLASARVIRARYDVLRLEALGPRQPEDADGLREIHARVRADDTLLRRFVAPSERATFVYAELAPGRSAEQTEVLARSIHARFDRSPDLGVTLLGVGPGKPARGALLWAALMLAALSLALAPGGWRAAALACLGAVALTAFGQALLGLLGEPGRALGRFVPELFAASALSSSFALIQRSRAERRREPVNRISVAAALEAVGPELAVGALLSVSGFAALLALAPGLPLARGLGAAAGMAAGLVAYPLGLALAGLIAWPEALARPPGELASALARRAEHCLVRPGLIACVAVLVSALAACALTLLAPKPGAVQLRTVVLDSGAEGRALEPEFLERVAAYQREAATKPGVVWSSSLVDSVVAPANRALHDGDALFATVPLTRTDVERALRPWYREERATLERQIDAGRRRVAVELLVVPSIAAAAPVAARSLASTLLMVILVGALGGRLLRSSRGGLLCALPAATTALITLILANTQTGGLHGAGAALAPLAGAVSAGLGLQLLARMRALLEAGAQLEVALPLALRETGPVLASAALASAALVAALGAAASECDVGIGLACLAPLIGAAVPLAILPALLRANRGRFFATRFSLRAGVSATERGAAE